MSFQPKPNRKSNLKKIALILLVILLGIGALWVWSRFSKNLPGRSANIGAGSITQGTTSNMTIIAGCCGTYMFGSWRHNGLVAGDFLLVGITTYTTAGAVDGPAASNEITGVTITKVGGGASVSLTRVPNGFVATGTAWPSLGSCAYPSDCSEKPAGIGVQYFYTPNIPESGDYNINDPGGAYTVGLASAFHNVNVTNPFVNQAGGMKTVSSLTTSFPSAMTVNTGIGGWVINQLGIRAGSNITPTSGTSTWLNDPLEWPFGGSIIAMSRANSATNGSPGSVGWNCTSCSTFLPNQLAVALNPAPPPPPTLTLTSIPANPIPYNTAATLTWTITNATSCTNTSNNMPSGTWSDATPSTGSGQTLSLTSNTKYTLTCNNSLGESVEKSVTVTVGGGATATLQAVSPKNSGETSILTWTYTGTATTCRIDPGIGSFDATAGSGTKPTDTLTQTTTFTLICDDAPPASATVTINSIIDLDDPDAPTNTACNAITTNAYCFRTSLDQKRFVLWVKLENSNDPELSDKPDAKCNDNDFLTGPYAGLGKPATTPPDIFNYCIKSPQ